MDTKPKPSWLDSLLRKVFRTPIPAPMIVEVPAKPEFLPYEIDVVARLRQQVAELEAYNSALTAANRDLKAAHDRYERAYRVCAYHVPQMHQHTREEIQRELSAIFRWAS